MLKQNNRIRPQCGFSLIELAVVLIITAILAGLGVPAFFDVIDRSRIKSATETVYANLQYAKSEAIKRNARIQVVFATAADPWRYYLTQNIPCNFAQVNPAASDFCGIDGVRRVVDGSEYKDIVLTSTANPIFDHMRGLVTNPGTVTLTSPRNKETRVRTTLIGNISLCSPSDASKTVWGYPACP